MKEVDALFSTHKSTSSSQSQLIDLPQYFANKNKNTEQEDIEKRREAQLKKLGPAARRKAKTPPKQLNLSDSEDEIPEDGMQKFKQVKHVYPGDPKDPEADPGREESEAANVNLGEEELDLLKKTFAEADATENQARDASIDEMLLMPAPVMDPKEIEALDAAIASISEQNNGDEEQ